MPSTVKLLESNHEAGLVGCRGTSRGPKNKGLLAWDLQAQATEQQKLQLRERQKLKLVPRRNNVTGPGAKHTAFHWRAA